MKIIITGSPGTGKTSISKELAKKMSIQYVDVNTVLKENPEIVLGFDKEKDCQVIDELKLAKLLENREGVIESHLVQFMNPKRVDVCIVLRCSAKELTQRLKKRGYSKKKIEENVEAEIMNICGDEAFRKGHDTIEIDTTKKKPKSVALEIKEMILGKQG